MAQAAATDAVFGYLPDTLIAPADGPDPTLTADFKEGYEANEFSLPGYGGTFWQIAQLEVSWVENIGPANLTACGVAALVNYDWQLHGMPMIWGLLGGSGTVITPGAGDMAGANNVIPGDSLGYGNPASYSLRDMVRVDSLPIGGVFGPAMHLTGPSADLLNLDNTPSAVGEGGYSQSPLPTTTAGTQPAAGTQQTAAPSLMNVPAQPQGLAMQVAGAPAGGVQSNGNANAQPANQAPPNEAPANGGAAANDSSVNDSPDSAGASLVVAIVVEEPDPAKKPADAEDRSAGEPEKSTGQTQQQLAEPDKEAETPIYGPPAPAAPAAGGGSDAGNPPSGNSSASGSAGNQSAADSQSAGLIVIIIAAPPSQPPLRVGPDPNSPLAPPVPDNERAGLWLVNHALAMQAHWQGSNAASEPGDGASLAAAAKPELAARVRQLKDVFDQAEAAGDRQAMGGAAEKLYTESPTPLPPYMAQRDLWVPRQTAKLATRVSGMGRTVEGATEVVVGVAIFVVQPAAGLAAIAHGGDTMVAGIVMVVTGDYRATFTERTITLGANKLGFSPSSSQTIGAIGDAGIPIIIFGAAGLRSSGGRIPSGAASITNPTAGTRRAALLANIAESRLARQTSGFATHLNRETIAAIRSANKISAGKNIAVFRYSIEGDSGVILAVSGGREGFAPIPHDGARVFSTFSDRWPRGADAEVLGFESLVSKGFADNANGAVHLLTERGPCESCLFVIDQFEVLYPNIRVIVVSAR